MDKKLFFLCNLLYFTVFINYYTKLYAGMIQPIHNSRSLIRMRINIAIFFPVQNTIFFKLCNHAFCRHLCQKMRNKFRISKITILIHM